MIDRRICFVVQRYGLEVNGGAELHCRQLAEHMLTKYNDIHVVTTKAKDYISWENEYDADEETINGIVVHRFPTTHPRDEKKVDDLYQKFLRVGLTEEEEQRWVCEQGPETPNLLQYLRDHKDDYAVFIFFTYLYYPTVLGIPEVADKAIVIPTAHDEPFLRMKIYRNVFCLPRGFFYNTEEERQLINKRFGNADIPSSLGGVGVDLPKVSDGNRFKKKYGLTNYITYVGRVDKGKNCRELFEFFLEYHRRNHSDIKLVLMGRNVIPIPEDDNIISLGFTSDQDKFDGIDGALALVLPSKFESLSMVVLEAMSLYTPVIVNGTCDVLRGHCAKSNGAFYYNSYYEFEEELDYLRTNPAVVKQMTDNAKKYVDENYQWDIITEKLSEMIELVMK